MHRGSCDGPFNIEERAGCQFGHSEEKKSLIAGMPKAVVHLKAPSLYWPVFRGNGFCFLLKQIKDGVVDQTAFAEYVDKYIQEKNATVWKDALQAALKNCSVSVRKYWHI